MATSRAIDNTSFTDFELMLEEGFEWCSTNSGRTTSRQDTLRSRDHDADWEFPDPAQRRWHHFWYT